jgi:hypothetical protein
MQVCEPLHGIGEGLLVDLGILRPDTVADSAVVDSGEFKVHGVLRTLARGGCKHAASGNASRAALAHRFRGPVPGCGRGWLEQH